MPPEGFERVYNEYSLRGNPSWKSLASQIQGDFLFYDRMAEKRRLDYVLRREGAFFFVGDTKEFFTKKDGVFASIKAPKSEDDLRVPFGKNKPTILEHIEDRERVGTVFVPRFVICNIGGLTAADLYLASYSNRNTLTHQTLIDYLNRYAEGRRFDEFSLVSVYYLAGFNVEDETQVADPLISLPIGPPIVSPPSILHDEPRWEPPSRRESVGYIQWKMRRGRGRRW